MDPQQSEKRRFCQCTYVCIIEIRNTRVTSRPRHWGSRACITKQRTQLSRCTHEFRSRCLNYTGWRPIRQPVFPFLEQLTNRSDRFGQIHGKSGSFSSPVPWFSPPPSLQEENAASSFSFQTEPPGQRLLLSGRRNAAESRSAQALSRRMRRVWNSWGAGTSPPLSIWSSMATAALPMRSRWISMLVMVGRMYWLRLELSKPTTAMS